MAEPPSGEKPQQALNVDLALTSINDLLDRVRVVQDLVRPAASNGQANGKPPEKNKEAEPQEPIRSSSGFFGLKFLPTAKERGVKPEKARPAGRSRVFCFGGAAGKTVANPSRGDGAGAAEIPEVKPGLEAEKAVGDQIGAAVTGGGEGGSSSTGEKAVRNSISKPSSAGDSEADRAVATGTLDGGGSTGEKAVGNPSSSDRSCAAEIRDVKSGVETGAKATNHQIGSGNSGGGRAAVTGAGDGGSTSTTSDKEVKPEAAATGSPKLPASSGTNNGSSRQPNGSIADGRGDDFNVKKDSSSASSMKLPTDEKRKVYNQAEKMMRDLNNIHSELLKLKALDSHFQGLQNPTKKLDWVLQDKDKATSIAAPTLHKELQELADKVKVVKNQMPGHSAPAMNTEGGHKVDDESKFHDYQLLDKVSVLDMKEKIPGTACFEGILRDFGGAFAGLDIQSKLCLCCFSIFPEDAVVHKKLLVYWWIGEGLVDSHLPGGNKAADTAKKAADKGKKVLDTAKKVADKGKKVVGTAKQAADKGKQTADKGKQAADKGKKAADTAKKAADKGKKAADMAKQAADIGKNAAHNGNKTADKVLMELCSKGFIEPVLKKRKLCGFKMDPLVRFAVIITAEKLGFFTFDRMGVPTADFSSSHRACLVQDQEGNFSRRDLTREKDSGSSNKEKDKERDADSSNRVGDNSKVKNMDHLHTLFNVNDPYPDFKLDWFVKLRMLNVLYLGGWQGSKGPHIEVEGTEFLSGLRNMKYLKFLSLQGISRINDLPDSLCALTNLKILDLNACHHLESLPKQLGELKNLTHLDISQCYLLDHIPKGLGQLSHLQVLKGFVIGGSGDNKDSCTLDDLKGLKNLRKLSITSSRDDFPLEKEVIVLQGFEYLKSLTIAWGGKSSKAEAEAVKTDDGKPKNKDERGTSIEQQEGGGSSAEQMDTDKKAVSTPQQVPGNTAEQKGVKGERAEQSVAGPKKEDIGERGVQHDASAKAPETIQSRQSAKPAPTAKSLWASTRNRLQLTRAAPGLEKLELQCCPLSEAPSWMLKGKLKPRKKLYIRGGDLRTLKDVKGTPVLWTVKILCLKYLADLEMNWCELLELFPDLAYLENSRCPKLTYFPCNSSGVWISRNQELLDKAKQDFSWSFLK